MKSDTEPKSTEPLVADSANLFQEIADTAPVMIWASGCDKLCNYFNKPWLEFTGRPLEQELGNGWTNGIHPDDFDRCLEIYTKSFDARHAFAMEYRLRRHDGAFRWLKDNGKPRFSADGHFLGFIGSCIDITDEKEIQTKLEEVHNQSNLPQLAAHVGIWNYNLITGETFLSNEYRILFGIQNEASPRYEHILSLVHPEDHDRLYEETQQAFTGKRPLENEFRIVRVNDGAVRWLKNKGEVILDDTGRTTHAVGAVWDITDLKQAEESLRESEEHSRTQSEELEWIYRNAPIGLGLFDLGLHYLRINQRLADLGGLPIAQHIGLHISDVVPAFMPTIAAATKKVMATGQPVIAQEVEGPNSVRPDVSRAYSHTWYPIFNKGGEIHRFGVVVEDITDRKNAEFSLREHQKKILALNADLEAKIEARTADLRTQAGLLTLQKESLAANERQFRAFMDADNFLAWIKDESLNYVYVNKAFEETFNVRLADCPGLNDYNLFAKETAEQFRNNDLLAIQSGHTIEFEEQLISKDKKTKYFLASKFSFIEISGKRLVAGIAVDITDRKRIEHALKDSEEKFRTLADSSPVPIAISGFDEAIDYLNPAFTKHFGYELRDTPTWSDWFLKAYPDPDYRQKIKMEWSRRLEKSLVEQAEIEPLDVKIRCKNGEDRFVIIGANFLDYNEKSLVGTAFDVTEIKLAQKRIKKLGSLYAVLSRCNEAIIHCDTEKVLFNAVCRAAVNQGVVKFAWIGLLDRETSAINPVASFGLATNYLNGIRITALADDPTGLGPTGIAVREGRPVWIQDFPTDPITGPWHERAKDYAWGSSAALPIRRCGNVVGALTIYFTESDYFDEEIQQLLLEIASSVSFALDTYVEKTERERANRLVEELAHFDPLTGLPNRRLFVDKLHERIAQDARHRGRGFAILLIDLDNFKDVNDTLGHPIGDQLLDAVARELQAAVRRTDTVGRLGGDEFVVIQSDIKSAADAAILSEKILKRLSAPFIIEGNRILTSGSIGIAVYGPESLTAGTLVSHADVALYRAKAQRGTYAFFTKEMDTEVRSRFEIISELREAIAADQFFLVYQPQIECDTGCVKGLEALARWHHPIKGIIAPDTFIPLAESSGLIVEIGEQVLRKACYQMKKWADAAIAPSTLAVNVSAVQLKESANFKHKLKTILKETDLSPQWLELEITEGAFADVAVEPGNIIDQLRECGTRLAIDDFGTGYSSLEYLSQFPVDRIKIAQKFITNLTLGSRNLAIVRASILLARELGINVIVEGVETREQFELLNALGCAEYQGYYFSKPQPVEAITEILRQGKITPLGRRSYEGNMSFGSE